MTSTFGIATPFLVRRPVYRSCCCGLRSPSWPAFFNPLACKFAARIFRRAMLRGETFVLETRPEARCPWPAPGARVTEAIRHDPGLTATRREHVPLGILYMVGATIVFAMSSATSQWLVDIYPGGGVLF